MSKYSTSMVLNSSAENLLYYWTHSNVTVVNGGVVGTSCFKMTSNSYLRQSLLDLDYETASLEITGLCYTEASISTDLIAHMLLDISYINIDAELIGPPVLRRAQLLLPCTNNSNTYIEGTVEGVTANWSIISTVVPFDKNIILKQIDLSINVLTTDKPVYFDNIGIARQMVEGYTDDEALLAFDRTYIDANGVFTPKVYGDQIYGSVITTKNFDGDGDYIRLEKQYLTFHERGDPDVIKMAMGFVENKDGVAIPGIVLGAGNGNGSNRGYIQKDTNGLSMYYIGNKDLGQVSYLTLQHDKAVLNGNEFFVKDANNKLAKTYISDASTWDSKLSEIQMKAVVEDPAKLWDIPQENLSGGVSTKLDNGNNALGYIVNELGRQTNGTYPKLTKLTDTGVYTGTVEATQITAGTIAAERIAVLPDANILNAANWVTKTGGHMTYIDQYGVYTGTVQADSITTGSMSTATWSGDGSNYIDMQRQMLKFQEDGLTKMAIGFLPNKDNVMLPIIALGAGDGYGNSRGYIQKDTDGISMYYVGNLANNEVSYLKLTKDKAKLNGYDFVVKDPYNPLSSTYIADATSWNAKLSEVQIKSVMEDSSKAWNIPKQNLADSDVSSWDSKETPTGAQSKADTAYSNATSYASGLNSTLRSNLNLSAPLPATVVQDGNGITATATGQPTKWARLGGAGLQINNGAIEIKNGSGITMIDGTGINASTINVGTISANRIATNISQVNSNLQLGDTYTNGSITFKSGAVIDTSIGLAGIRISCDQFGVTEGNITLGSTSYGYSTTLQGNIAFAPGSTITGLPSVIATFG